MAYTNAFDPTEPADGDLVSYGDDMIRELKAAVKERMETIVEDFNDDPLQLKASALQLPGTSRISHAQFQPQQNTSAFTRNIDFICPGSSATLLIYGSIGLIADRQVSIARIRVRKGTGATVTGEVFKVTEDANELLGSFSLTTEGSWEILEAPIATGIAPGDQIVFAIFLDPASDAEENTALAWAEVEHS